MPTFPSVSAPLSTLAGGFLLSLSLIAAIGAQNLFVLRQGLQRQYVGMCVLFCASADAVLTALGMAGMAALVAGSPRWAHGMAAAGALFLLAYGGLALRRAWQGGSHATVGHNPTHTRPLVLAQLAALTLLNPHVYLDTVLLIGSMGARQPGPLQGAYLGGVVAASLCWFVALGYGARWLQPLFVRPVAWRMLDGLTGCTLLALAAGLLTTLA
jgi:L-lysine exporter family protein LysE/ArgO